MPYFKQDKPFVVPTSDGKLIEEHFGKASTQQGAFSVAHMVAPPGWAEPYQTPDFDEVTILIEGKKQIEMEGDVVVLNPGESLLIKKGTRVRYSNPFAQAANYWSICIPAFSPDSVWREE